MTKHWYTDGACSGNPGPGGWSAVRFEDNDIIQVTTEYLYNTTNNRCELMALLYVVKLAAADKDNKYIIYSDSTYAINCITMWMYNWANNGWQNSKKKTVENLDLIKEFYSLMSFPLPNVEFVKVRGHDGDLGNEIADSFAARNKTKYLTLIKKNNIEESYLFEV